MYSLRYPRSQRMNQNIYSNEDQVRRRDIDDADNDDCDDDDDDDGDDDDGDDEDE